MSSTDLARLAGKYLTFRLGAEDYGLQILKVQEIIGMMNVTRVPRMPDFVRGIINLRGKLIPVVDLREKFNLEKQADTLKTCIIVVEIVFSESKITLGVLVDNVSEVMNISEKEIEGPPQIGMHVNTEFMLGMGKLNQKVIMLLDIDRVLGSGELSELARVGTKNEGEHHAQ